MATKEEKKVEEVVEAPKKEQPKATPVKPEGVKQTTLPNGTIRTDY